MDSWADVIPRAIGTFVLDEQTNAPVPGALITRHLEMLDTNLAE